MCWKPEWKIYESFWGFDSIGHNFRKIFIDIGQLILKVKDLCVRLYEIDEEVKGKFKIHHTLE